MFYGDSCIYIQVLPPQPLCSSSDHETRAVSFHPFHFKHIYSRLSFIVVLYSPIVGVWNFLSDFVYIFSYGG